MEKYLDKCLTSLIIADTVLFEQLEVLVIIDGATDQSSTIAHSYQERFPDVFVVIDKENGNYGSCINKGLQIATGKYVKVLDADDSFNTTNFEDYLRFLNGVDVDMVITPYTTVDESGKELRVDSYDLPANILLSWQQLMPAFKKKSLQMHAVTYKLKNIQNLQYRQTEGISYTDQEWIFTPLSAVDTATAYPNAIYRYLVGRAGQTMNANAMKRNISHNEQCCRRIINDYVAFGAFKPDKQEYIDYKFNATLQAMYKWYLLRYPDLDIQTLVDYDDFVKSLGSKYVEWLDTQVVQHTHYRYIKHWHRNRDRRNTLCRIVNLYSKIIHKFYSYVR